MKEAEQQKKELQEVRTQQKVQTEMIERMMRYIQKKQEEEASEEARRKGQEWNGDMVGSWDDEWEMAQEIDPASGECIPCRMKNNNNKA